MAGNPVIWFEIHVNDMARAKTFYEAVFDLKLQDMSGPASEMWGFPMAPDQVGVGGMLVRMEGLRPGGNSTIVYFSCDDCAVQEARAAVYGGKVFKPKFTIGEYGFSSLVFDTEGNMIGLHSMK